MNLGAVQLCGPAELSEGGWRSPGDEEKGFIFLLLGEAGSDRRSEAARGERVFERCSPE